MPEENTELSENAIAAEGSSEATASRKRKRTRKPRAKAAAEKDAATDGAPHGSDADPAASEQSLAEAPSADATQKPRSRRAPRSRRTAAQSDQTTDASRRDDLDVAGVDPEIAQARALAKISQASIVRRQRKAAERAAEMIASPDVTAPAAGTVPAELPLIDPTLRPHRRGRKPKAYIEAERAAARRAAEAARGSGASAPADASAADSSHPNETTHQQPSAIQERPSGHERSVTGSSESSDSSAQQASRPGRPRRDHTRAASARGAGERNQAGVAQKSAEQGFRERSEPSKSGAQNRTQNQNQNSNQNQSQVHSQGQNGTQRRQHQVRHGERPHSADRSAISDRRGNRTQQNRKQRGPNRYTAPVEPSLTRDMLSVMKVAELREKGTELELDVAGKKKAELIEEIYTAAAAAEGFRDVEGILDIANDGFGHIRAHGYMPSHDDAFVPANLIRQARLRSGDLIVGTLRPSRPGDKFPGLARISSVNGHDPEELRHRPKFSELTPIYPNERLQMEHGRETIAGRAIDIVAPVGKGQRGLIVSPPKAGKTTILKRICQSIAANNPEVHLICLLVDERPEEVTDMQRSIRGDVVASTFDMPADNHTRVSELVIERAKRIVEMGGDVVVVLDSITRLARAYNLAAPASGRILSGGVDSAALYPPKRFLGAARNIENGGSLTILASALVDTGSKMDEVIFEEFKGTGNMELKLDRDLADRRIFPAINPVASGTRNEDLLIDETMRPFVWGIRRVLANMNNIERSASAFIKGLKSTASNEEFLVRSAKRAAEHSDALGAF